MSEDIVEYEIATDVSIISKAEKIAISDQQGYTEAGEFKSFLKKELKDREAYFERRCEEAQKVLEKRKNACKPYKDAIKIIQECMDGYLTRLENERQAAQAKAEEEARIKADKERQAFLDRAAKSKSEAKQAELLEKAEQVYAEPVAISSAQPRTMTTESGVKLSTRRDIEVDVVDLRKLCTFIGNGIVPDTVVDVKYSILKSWVKSAGIKNGQIPGIIIREKMKSFGG